MDRHYERVDHQKWLGGYICATIANWSMGAPKKPLTAADFMPSLKKAAPRKKRERLNRQKIAMELRSFLDARIREQKKC